MSETLKGYFYESYLEQLATFKRNYLPQGHNLVPKENHLEAYSHEEMFPAIFRHTACQVERSDIYDALTRALVTCPELRYVAFPLCVAHVARSGLSYTNKDCFVSSYNKALLS